MIRPGKYFTTLLHSTFSFQLFGEALLGGAFQWNNPCEGTER